MLRYAILTFITLFVLTLFGVGGSLVAGALYTAKIMFYAFVALIVLSLLLGPSLFRKR